MDLAEHNALSDEAAAELLAGVCAAPRWVDGMVGGRPYASVDVLLHTADRVLGELTVDDLDAALAGHPKIGATPSGAGAEQSRREQSGVDARDSAIIDALAEGNDAYAERFGRIYLVCASGRSGEDLLATLRERLGNDPETELEVTRDELGKINRLRLERLVTP